MPFVMIVLGDSLAPWQEGYDISDAFAAQQRDPLRRQLCGCLPWHKGEELFPARDWRPPRQDKPA
jgi:hypothetical protein